MMEEKILESYKEVVKTYVENTKKILTNFTKCLKDVVGVFKPFFEKYGYNIKYLNKVIYMAKYAKKKRVRNKYRNMIKRTLGEDKLNRLLND